MENRSIFETKKVLSSGKASLMQIMLDAFPCIALLLRPSTREIVASNKAAMKVGAVPGKKCYATWGQSPEPCPWCLATKVWKTNEAQNLEIEALGVVWDAHWIPVAPDLYMHFAFDITERKLFQEELTKLKQAIDASGDAVLMTDIHGTFTYVNCAFTQLYGYQASEIVGKSTPRILKSCIQPTEIYEGFWMALFNKKIFTTEFVNKTKDGRLLNIENSTSPIINAKGNIIGFLAVQRDVTDRKKMQQQLISQDRLVSIGQLVAGVAHELNNPLTSIIGFSDLLLQKEVPPIIESDLRIINDEAKRSAAIVNNLLTFSRQQSREKSKIDINQPINAVLQLRCHQLAVNNIQLISNLSTRLPKVLANDAELRQVFLNLIVNAEQAMSDANQRGILTINTEQNGSFIRASISDNGPGISRENLTHLFTPFFTTKEPGKGTGLGLSISQGIITEHGGKIWVESELSKGATFAVELPTSQD